MSLPRSRLAALILLLPVFQAVPAAALQGPADPIAAFEAQLRADVSADGIGSVAAAVIVDSAIVWESASGWADRDRHIVADANTLYRIGSISKSVTAAILMQLVERGIVALDDPVVGYLPEFAGLGGGVPEATAITLRQLASHTAGLIREPTLENAATGPIAQWEDKVIASIPTTSLRSAPGAEYAYSNIGFGILGLALSRAANEPFMDLVDRTFFAPLGMTSSTFVVRPPLDARLSVGYQNQRDGGIDAETPAAEHAGRGYKVPNGGIYSTAGDLARFAALMYGALGDDVLTESSRAEMLRRQTPGEAESGYGLGFFVGTDDAGHRFGYHSGSVAGYTALMFFDRDARTGVVLLRNYASGNTNLLAAARDLVRALSAATLGR